jgi:HEAT repeat protein
MILCRACNILLAQAARALIHSNAARNLLQQLIVVSLIVVSLIVFTCALPVLQARARAFAQAGQIAREVARLASTDGEERRDAVQRLGAIKRADASRAAIPALGDASAIVRATAVNAMLSLPPEEAARALTPLLQDRDEFVREQTAYALGQTRSHLIVPSLTNTLSADKSAGVRGAAAVALGEINDEAAIIPLTQALARRVRANGFLNRLRRRTVAENEFVRRSAARALGHIGSRNAVPALIAALTDPTASDDVRREAARSLGLINDPAAIPSLQSALTAPDPFLSRIAFEALQRLSPATATQVTAPPVRAPAKNQR